MAKRAPAKPPRDIAAEVMALINEQFDKGIVPWHKPWACYGAPVNIASGHSYRGVNVFLLQMSQDAKGYSTPVWGTYHQWKLASGYVHDTDVKPAKYRWAFKPGTDARRMSIGDDGKPQFGDTFRIASVATSGAALGTLYDEDGNEYPPGTYAEPGYGVRHGEKGTLVIFWKRIEYDRKDENGVPLRNMDGDVERGATMLMRHYHVFNADQCELPEQARPELVPSAMEFTPIEQAEQVANFFFARPSMPSLTHGGDVACYSRSLDAISMPLRSQFENAESYYSTLFHEAIHSTGHPSRLARFDTEDEVGRHSYSREELVAEMGAAMVMAHLAILNEPQVENSAAYIAHWREQCVNDPRIIISAAAQAQRAVDMVLDVSWEETE